ncbi:MAG: LPXTG cell wall anchor domain-containing protein [Candidatus Saccharibacteria bacterium]
MRANQKGSIISFVIVGALLGLAAVGLFYWLGHQSPDTPQVKEPEVTVPAPAEPKKSDSSQPAPTKKDSTSNKSTASPQPAANPGSQATPNADLPHTGPTETFTALLVIGFLTATSVAYVRSRRHLASL